MENNFNHKRYKLMKEKNPFSSIFSRVFSKSSRENDKNHQDDNNIQTQKDDSGKAKVSLKQKTAQAGFMILALVVAIGIIAIIAAIIGIFVSIIRRTNGSFNISSVERSIKELLVQIFYGIAKWILCFVDIVFSYVKRLCGLNMDFSSLSGIFSAESDMVFNLLITAEERASAIFRNLIVLTIVMIIIFTIIALIKAQMEAIQKMKPANVMDTIKRTIKAFVLMLITPFLALGGIAFSDLLLQTLFRATNTTGAMTLGSQVFSSASVSANAYRNYATNNARIPIVCNFKEDKEILEYYKTQPLSETFSNYLQSSENLIYVTYMSFLNNDFNKFNDLNDILDSSKAEYREKIYYGIYDIIFDELDAKKGLETKKALGRIDAYSEEYYVMADVIDFAVNTNNNLYIKTIQEVLDSIANIPNYDASKSIFNLIVQKYGIKFYNSVSRNESTYRIEPHGEITEPGREFISLEQYQNNNKDSENTWSDNGWNVISYASNYISPDDSGEPSNPMQIPYFHLIDQTDEVYGAKYIMAVESHVTIGQDTYTYYEPLTNGYADRYDASFKSEYIMNGQIIAAKGTFKDAEYPTAIKQNVNGICFYRHDIEGSAVGYLNDFFKFNMRSGGGPFGQFLMMLQAFFNPDSVLGDLSLNPQAITVAPEFSISNYGHIENGKVKLGYFFAYEPKDGGYIKGSGTLAFKEIFIPTSFNLLLIVVAPILLVKICLTAFMALVQRSFELFLIILTYPAACATIPLDDRSYNAWWKEGYIQRLFSTYGLILGLNFVFMLFPIITSLKYFSPTDIATNKVVYKICNLFFGYLTINQMTNLLNATTTILFELVAFTLIETVPQVINRMIGVLDPKSDFMDGVKKILNGITKVTKFVGKVIGTVLTFIPHIVGMARVAKGISKNQKAIENLHKLQNFKRKLLPGSAVLDSINKKKTDSEKAKETKKVLNKLGTSLNNSSGEIDGMEKPKRSDKKYNPKGAESDETLKQKCDEQYEKDLKQWEAANTMGTKEHADAIKAQYQELLEAQQTELQQIQNSADQTRNEKDDKKRDERIKKQLGLENENDENDEEDEEGTSNQKVDEDGEGEEGGEGGAGGKKTYSSDSYSKGQLRRRKRSAKRTYKRNKKRKKILEKRLKWEKKHGSQADVARTEKALNGMTDEVERSKEAFNEAYAAHRERKEEDKTLKHSKDPKEIAEIQKKRADRKVAIKKRKKEEKAERKEELREDRKNGGDKTIIGRFKKRRRERRKERLQQRDLRRKQIFAQTKGTIFQRARRKMQRGLINHSLNRQSSRQTKKLVRLNEELEELKRNGDQSDDRTKTRMEKLEKEIAELNGQARQTVDFKTGLNQTYMQHKNQTDAETDEGAAGITEAGKFKRGMRHIFHPIQMHRHKAVEREMSRVDISDLTKTRDDLLTQITTLRQELEKPVTNQQERKAQLAARNKINELTIELEKTQGLITRKQQWYEKDNVVFRAARRQKRKNNRRGRYDEDEQSSSDDDE